MRGKAVILTPWAEGVQGRNELFAAEVEAVFAVVVGAADMGAVAVAAVSVEPVGVDVLGWVAAALVAAAVAAAAAGPAPEVAGNDTGAGGPIWLDGV